MYTENQCRVGWYEFFCAFCAVATLTIAQIVWDIKVIDALLMHFLESFGKACHYGVHLHDCAVGRVEHIVVDQLTSVINGHYFGVVGSCRAVVQSWVNTLVLPATSRFAFSSLTNCLFCSH